MRGTEAVRLSPKAYDVLVALVQQRGRLVTKDELLKRLWPELFVEELARRPADSQNACDRCDCPTLPDQPRSATHLFTWRSHPIDSLRERLRRTPAIDATVLRRLTSPVRNSARTNTTWF